MFRTISTCLAVLALLTGTPAVAQAQEAKPAPSRAASSRTPAVVNLNTATAAQIATLPGIGPATAQRIIEHREKNGPFKKIEELMNVKGIGEKSFLKLKPFLSVGESRTAAAKE